MNTLKTEGSLSSPRGPALLGVEATRYLVAAYGAAPTDRLGSCLFHFHRFGVQQGHYFSQFRQQAADMWTPFASRAFIHLVFASHRDQLRRERAGSIHHKLAARLGGTPALRTPFVRPSTSGGAAWRRRRDWAIGKAARVAVRLRGGDTNTILRRRFLLPHRGAILERVTSQDRSPLWRYLARDRVQGLVDKAASDSPSARDVATLGTLATMVRGLAGDAAPKGG